MDGEDFAFEVVGPLPPVKGDLKGRLILLSVVVCSFPFGRGLSIFLLNHEEQETCSTQYRTQWKIQSSIETSRGYGQIFRIRISTLEILLLLTLFCFMYERFSTSEYYINDYPVTIYIITIYQV